MSDGELAVARTVWFCVSKVTPGFEITDGCLMESGLFLKLHHCLELSDCVSEAIVWLLSGIFWVSRV